MFTNSELHYLRDTNQYQERMFDEGYLEFLRNVRLPDYELDVHGDDLVLEFSGAWGEVTYWETIALSIISEMYNRTLLRGMSRFERDVVMAEGVRRLRHKIGVLRARPGIRLSDFGTRRRFTAAWQHYVVETLRDELNAGSVDGPFLGTSITYAAMLAGVAPMGTSAHELPMIIAGVLDDGGDDPAWLQQAQRQVIDDWWEQYGWGLSIFLPDTFGSDFFFTVVKADDLRRWKGFRWDSGDLFAFGERVRREYQKCGVDAGEKLLVPSDALELPVILAAHERFEGRIRVSYGWGTGLTNDLWDDVMVGNRWFGPMSLVLKPITANGRGVVKLSDNAAKATGRPEDIERYRRAASYSAEYSEVPKY
jgi:nicotinate phosphoribosyltransferase